MYRKLTEEEKQAVDKEHSLDGMTIAESVKGLSQDRLIRQIKTSKEVLENMNLHLYLIEACEEELKRD